LLLKKLGGLFLLLFMQCTIHAQDSDADTVPVLRYEIDTTIVQPADEPILDENETTVAIEETKPEPEYFLRKEFTGGFTDTLKFRKLPDSTLQRFLDDDAFWYANASFKKKQPKQKQGGGFISSTLFQTLLWLVIIGGFATFLIIYLSSSNVGLFRRSRIINEETEEMETTDIFAINYQKEIDKAIASNDFRLAVRLMYLKLLKQLADRNIIQYKHDSTNFEYLLQLQSTNMYPEFYKLTRNYEYSWYGQFEVDKEKFAVIRKDFDQFDRKLY